MYKSKKKLFKNYLKILFFIISFVNKVVYELLYRIKLAKYFYSEIYIQLETADKYIRKHNYTQAAMIYKEIIGKQPTLSTIYSLGIKVSKKGGINNEFFQAVTNLIDTQEIAYMIKVIQHSPEIYQPSIFWIYFILFNSLQIETGGIENFKLTVNQNYFNWTGENDIEIQIKSLKEELNLSQSEYNIIEKNIKGSNQYGFSSLKWIKYSQLLCLLCEFSRKNDEFKIFDKIEEPKIGNPITILYKERLISQDLCNTVYEVNTILQNIKYSKNSIIKIVELGAGSGRIGNVIFQTIPNVQYIIIDIPPALYVSQWYLTNLYPNKKTFRFKDFISFSDIRKEFEESELIFLSPAQIELLPEKYCDLFINICSLQEMTHEKVENWFNQINRICKGYFYSKQYIESKNGFDEIVICKEDYPVKDNWKVILDRKNPIFPLLFETIYEIT